MSELSSHTPATRTSVATVYVHVPLVLISSSIERLAEHAKVSEVYERCGIRHIHDVNFLK